MTVCSQYINVHQLPFLHNSNVWEKSKPFLKLSWNDFIRRRQILLMNLMNVKEIFWFHFYELESLVKLQEVSTAADKRLKKFSEMWNVYWGHLRKWREKAEFSSLESWKWLHFDGCFAHPSFMSFHLLLNWNSTIYGAITTIFWAFFGKKKCWRRKKKKFLLLPKLLKIDLIHFVRAEAAKRTKVVSVLQSPSSIRYKSLRRRYSRKSNLLKRFTHWKASFSVSSKSGSIINQ